MIILTQAEETMQEYTFTQLQERWGVDRVSVWRWWRDGRFGNEWRRKGPGKTSPVVVQETAVLRFERENDLVPPSSP